MNKIKATLDFVAFSINDKIEFYKYVAIQLANTLLFPAPEIPISTINATLVEFEAAILAAESGSHAAKSFMHDLEKVADDMFRILVSYVNKVAKGDETILIKSGFHLSKQPNVIPKAEISVRDGAHSGDVIVVIKAVKSAVAYKIRYKLVGALGLVTEWVEAEISTVATSHILGLIPGQTYQFIYASISSAGTTDFSNPISKMVV